jgi:endoglucanase
MIVPHNYGRWYGKINTDVDAFQVYWKNLASLFKDNDKVVFDTNNECTYHRPPTILLPLRRRLVHDMPQPLTVKLNQAAINGIRAAGATTQYITVEGNSWSGAWTWTSSGNGATMGSLTDPSDKLLYQMHQYLDIDGSGTHEACVSSTIGVERLRDATAWLKKNKKVGIIGEFAGGDNPVCKKAITGMLEYMVENKDVWQGAIWWAAGPWWGKYMFDMEPNKGIAWKAYMDLIARYA